MRGFLFILELSAGCLGFLDAFARDFLGSLGNSPFRAYSARLDASSISAVKLNLFRPTEREERGTRSKEKSKWTFSLSKFCLGEPCLMVLDCFSVLGASAFLLRT